MVSKLNAVLNKKGSRTKHVPEMHKGISRDVMDVHLRANGLQESHKVRHSSDGRTLSKRLARACQASRSLMVLNGALCECLSHLASTPQ